MAPIGTPADGPGLSVSSGSGRTHLPSRHAGSRTMDSPPVTAGATLLGAAVALGCGLPLAWKWELGLHRSAATITGFSILAGAGLAATDASVDTGMLVEPAIVAALALAMATGVVVWRFYRDPPRTAPATPDVVVSPADGLVVYVQHAERG